MKRLIVAALFLVFSAATGVAGDRTVKLEIANMSCALCPLTVAKAIEGVAGVKDVAVDYKAKTATVVYDDARTTVRTLAQASTHAGYPASEVK